MVYRFYPYLRLTKKRVLRGEELNTQGIIGLVVVVIVIIVVLLLLGVIG